MSRIVFGLVIIVVLSVTYINAQPQVQCGENEEFNECGSSCPTICGTPRMKCVKMCRQGCFCINGYTRLSVNGPCVKECPS